MCRSSLIAILVSWILWTAIAQAQEPLRIGALYSQTGTMAISETGLRDALRMLVQQQNARGGVLGRPLELVVLDPQSKWLMYGEKARQLLEREEVVVIFGCWTSASRKEVKDVVEELNGLLFYPVQYEGQEQSPNIFYLGATPNQQALPAVRYLFEDRGVERWVLAGTDYIYPRTTNRMLVTHLLDRGVAAEDIMISYTPFGHEDWERTVGDIREFGGTGRKTAVISTINGSANVAFYRELAAQGVTANLIPVLAFSVGEAELQAMDVAPMVGHLAAWNYFMSLESRENSEFISRWQAYTGDAAAVTADPLEAQAIGFRLWVEAVELAGGTTPEQVRETIIGLRVPNLSGGETGLLANHHLSKPVYIGQVQPDGQYEVVWRSPENVDGDPWYEPLSIERQEKP